VNWWGDPKIGGVRGKHTKRSKRCVERKSDKKKYWIFYGVKPGCDGKITEGPGECRRQPVREGEGGQGGPPAFLAYGRRGVCGVDRREGNV